MTLTLVGVGTGCYVKSTCRHVDLDYSSNRALSVAKYHARFQLAFSETQAVQLPSTARIFVVPDCVAATGGALMTDGAAPISRALMNHVTQQLGWAQAPTAFQGRIGGCKGVWYVVPESESDAQPSVQTGSTNSASTWLAGARCVFPTQTRGLDGSDMWLAYRPSMVKVGVRGTVLFHE